MARRTQITLSEAQYARLKDESERTGASLSELVRRAIEDSYGLPRMDDARSALQDSFGAWGDRDFDGAKYVERLRRGMARRLAE
ncbi:MAG: ribbon-helix-helix domain-containing protein [Actinobacteria bacterium]|nr:ribbon-helix-helix domain-containing protein [Actinomycetota bacterium]